MPFAEAFTEHSASHFGIPVIERGEEREQTSAPHRADPVENLNSGGNAYRHRGEGEKAVGVGVHSYRKHVVRPDAHTDECDAHGCGNHHRIPEDWLARKDGNDFRHESKTRNDQNVDFRMSKDPKEVHPEDCRSAGLSIKEMASQISIDQQHDLSSR